MAVLLLVGIVLTAMNRRNHGRAAILGMVGCILLLLGVVYNTLFGYFAPTLIRSSGIGLTGTIAMSNLISLIFNAGGTGLLIWAVVARRNPPQPSQPQGPGWQQPPQPEWSQQQQPFQQPPGWQAPPRPPFGEGRG
ncbi:hypothetical protein ACFLIM_23000 [Nonomuraea sp. M3C6]|uniref:Uncharacterized protein n=1 Tax=Nonomuraea marmarensis TaxID=3351344 RepID=A0ABW7AIA8_9ACTN